jgi:hypothetical protein
VYDVCLFTERAGATSKFLRASPSGAPHKIKGDKKMKHLLTAAFVALLSLSVAAAAQNTNSSTTAQTDTTKTSAAKKRGPIFRATKDQIKQAQMLLKGRSFYAGEATGTLNRVTLEKMNITLTDKQKTIS